jgi:hypothetical protein
MAHLEAGHRLPSHHDNRKATLTVTPKDKVWDELDQATRGRSRTRADAIKFAIELFERQLNGRDKLPLLDLSKEEYEQLLHRAFDLADRMHEKWLAQCNVAQIETGQAAAQ